LHKALLYHIIDSINKSNWTTGLTPKCSICNYSVHYKLQWITLALNSDLVFNKSKKYALKARSREGWRRFVDNLCSWWNYGHHYYALKRALLGTSNTF
jgi:hypothetical protein